MNILQTKIEQLADELNISTEEITQSSYDSLSFETSDGSEYLVLTQEEKDQRLKDEIKESLWAFNASFVLDFAGIDYNQKTLEAFKTMQGELCESANDLVLAMIGGEDRLDEFVEDAVSADGAGHFLAQYNHEEIERSVKYYDQESNEDRLLWLFIYRTN